jgi:dTDP-4-amino-4,6-dideoxygalactose transaminase
MPRIFLSKADISPAEAAYVLEALDSGWVTPLGPQVDAFETEVAERVGVRHALALSSGTAALHLGLLGLGAKQGTVVLCPSLTFAASANAISYSGATPVFVDSSRGDGNVDAGLLLQAVDELRSDGLVIAAALTVDLFGRCADYSILEAGLADRGVPLLEDAAEAFGSMFGGRAAGSFGRTGVLSFNGNKIMTTSGGGMLLSDDTELIGRARYLSTQARQPAAWYEHSEVGFNYRLSNLLAALGRAQLSRLDEMINRRRAIRATYVDTIGQLPGVRVLGNKDPSKHYDNCWLTCFELDASFIEADVSEIIAKLEAEDIEARRLWKPMHLQPVWRGQRVFLNGNSERLFRSGLALPSGSSLTDSQIERVVNTLAPLLVS